MRPETRITCSGATTAGFDVMRSFGFDAASADGVDSHPPPIATRATASEIRMGRTAASSVRGIDL